MNKPIKKIAIILAVISLFPIIFFSINEYLSLNKNEKIIQDIYNKQLDAIIFSINQYSDDIVRSWIFKTEDIIRQNKDEKLLQNSLNKYLPITQSVKNIVLADTLLDALTAAKFSDLDSIRKIIKNNINLVRRFFIYKNQNYQKMESIDFGDDVLLLFVTNNDKICVFQLNKKDFVTKNLSGRIRSIASDKFDVGVFHSGETIYSTENFKIEKAQQSANFWLISRYKLAMSVKGGTLEEIIHSRVYTNIALIVALGLLMSIGVFFVYRNIKREMELAQIKSDFVSNVSHELRTPLALINMYAETLEMDRIKSEVKKKEYYSIISGETNRLSNIVNRILSFSKLEAGKRNFVFEKIDLNDSAKKIYETYLHHLQNKEFEFTFVSGGEVLISGDKEAISEVIVNLIDNASKYSNEIKKIILRTGVVNQFGFVEIEDSGIGISQDEQSKIFDKFYRAAKGLVHDTKGTGIGLALVKYIVDGHKGKIELESDTSKGSKFRILFPLEED
ncbi:MAG: HAMP domain-containing sensor histidine kinase [Melioribacteraceae bacterium]